MKLLSPGTGHQVAGDQEMGTNLLVGKLVPLEIEHQTTGDKELVTKLLSAGTGHQITVARK